MKGLINALTSWKSIVAFSFGGLVFASCSKEASDVASSLEEYQTKTYSEAFIENFGKPDAEHNWGFGAFEVAGVSKSIGSYEYFNSGVTRGVVGSVTPVNSKTYNTFADAMADSYNGQEHVAKCYFYLKIDNRIVLQEQNQVMSNPSDDFFPKGITHVNGVKDYLFSTDNEGLIDVAMLDRIANVKTGGVSYATDDEPIPAELFVKAPTFAQMAAHVPDADKARIAGSVAEFENNWKVFWYVAKWQGSGDKVIHVDGVVVPKDQITVNVPEYKKRIIVEDLKGNINAETTVTGSDFDYNDVVFDAVTWKDLKDKNHLKIILRAAGGKLPIYVKGKEIHEGIGYMFNTENPDYNYEKVIFNEIIADDAKTFDFNSIPVIVKVNGAEVTAGANIGEAPEKIAVGVDYKWCKERDNIKLIYPGFVQYVANHNLDKWWLIK